MYELIWYHGQSAYVLYKQLRVTLFTQEPERTENLKQSKDKMN